MIFSLHRFHCIYTYFFHQMCHISTIVLKCSHSSHILPWPFSPRDFLPKKSSSLSCLLVYFQPLAPTLTYYFTLGLLYCNLPSLEKLVISGSWRSRTFWNKQKTANTIHINQLEEENNNPFQRMKIQPKNRGKLQHSTQHELNIIW